VVRNDEPPEPDAKAWAKVNREAAQHRHRANEAEQRAATLETERNALKAERDAAAAARATAEAESAAARASVKSVTTQASLKVAAVAAGIVDLDALKLLDVAALEIADDGELKDPAKVMADLKAAKPYLFAAPSSTKPAVSTSNPTPPPAPRSPSKRPALDMTDAEFSAALKTGAWRT
jgi:hypothetical protein